MNQRSTQKEWIDLGKSYYSSSEYCHCLTQLDRIGRYLGGDRATLWAFNQLSNPPSSILDVGCGGGGFTRRVAAHYPDAQVVGIDLSSEAIAFAIEELNHSSLKLPNIEFTVPSSSRLSYSPATFDVVTATLVCHHLTDQELVLFLQDACHIAKQAVILNDLHRHPLATLGYACLTPFLNNRLIIHDGLLSIKRSFTYKEWIAYLLTAGISLERCSITWHWAFRWVVVIKTSKDI